MPRLSGSRTPEGNSRDQYVLGGGVGTFNWGSPRGGWKLHKQLLWFSRAFPSNGARNPAQSLEAPGATRSRRFPGNRFSPKSREGYAICPRRIPASVSHESRCQWAAATAVRLKRRRSGINSVTAHQRHTPVGYSVRFVEVIEMKTDRGLATAPKPEDSHRAAVVRLYRRW
jgi:hypothetical protein